MALRTDCGISKARDYPVHASLPLPRGSVLRVDDGQETLVRAGSGCIWITQEGERHDIVLEPGQAFRISRGGCTLIAALRDSVIALASPYERYFARRVELVPAGKDESLPLPGDGHGLRGRIAAFGARLMRSWLGLYAPAPRRPGVIV
jgi:hypothetical protein